MDFWRTIIRFFTYQYRFITSLFRTFKLDKIAKFFGKKPGKGLISFSLPARVGCLTFVFLLICLATFYISIVTTEEHGTLQNWRQLHFILILSALVIAIPIVVYKTLKLWLEGEGALFPDIEAAWDEGMVELDRLGVDLTLTPMFLIVGGHSEAQAQAMFDASQMEMVVKGVPAGHAALHWFYGRDSQGRDAIYLYCANVSCLSLLSRVAKNAGPATAAASGAAGGGGSRDIRSTMQVADIRDTMAGPSPAAAPTAPAPAMNIRGTMEVANIRDTMAGTGPGGAAAPAATLEQRIVVDKSDREEAQRRLQYLCKLIVRARKPFCPINGMLAVLPYKVLESQTGAGEMTVAATADLRVLHRAFKLRFPVNVLVSGLEDELGFQELVRRVGQADAAARRFGKGHDIWKTPLAEQMEALCSHACGAFEDWAYSLFRKDDALRKKTGNERLYLLLCKIRGRVQMHLEKVLAEGFGFDPDRQEDVVPPLFGGCYFAATGEREDRRAFVAGVLRDKLFDTEADVEWTDEAIFEDQRYHRWARTVMGIDALLAVALALVLYVVIWLPAHR
ncbi:MAG: type VI secretion protein IcmF/TssM N-terminal domain-containing protein [Pirellulales bacterium]